MSDDFYRRLDEKERNGRIARIFANRPENLHDYQGCANDAASRLTETKLPSSPAGDGEPIRKVLTRADIEKLNEGTHSCGWTIGAVKNPNPACGCMCGTVYAPDGRAILSHSGRHGMRCQHADERGNLLVPEPLGDISGPKGSHPDCDMWSGGAAPRRIRIPDAVIAYMNRELGVESAAPIAPAAQELVELIMRARKLMGSFLSVDDQVQTYAIHAPNWLQDLVKWYEDTACPICDGSGAVDSGGSEPWGAPIDIKCGACNGTGLKQFGAERKEGEAKHG